MTFCRPDVPAVIERGARRIACMALTSQGHQLTHLVVDEHTPRDA